MVEGETELIIEQIEIGPMQNYTYIVGSKETREVAIVDPAWDIQGLLDHLAERDYTLTAALATHYHPDHVGGSMGGHSIEGVAELMNLNPVKVYAHKHEADGVKKVTELSDNDIVKVDSGDTLKIGNIEVEFLHTPGHTPGSQCFRIKNTLVAGDTLFINGCGRVDLPGSNSDDMFASMFFGLLDPVTRTFTYANAGHPGPLLLRGANQEIVDHGVSVIPGAGHCAHLERPEAAAGAIRYFLSSLPTEE